MRATCNFTARSETSKPGRRDFAVALREQAAVHGHRLRAVFAQMHGAQHAVAAQRIVGATVRIAGQRGFAASSQSTTASSRHIVPRCGIRCCQCGLRSACESVARGRAICVDRQK